MSGDETESVAAVILAGGQSRRFGETKALAKLRGKSLLERVVYSIQSQCAPLLLSVNHKHENFRAFHLPLLADLQSNSAGPLAGIESALKYLRETGFKGRYLLSLSADCPFLPANLVTAFLNQEKPLNTQALYARYRGRDHYLIALWSCSIETTLSRYLQNGGRSVKGLLAQCDAEALDFDSHAYDPFFNINTRDDLQVAEQMLDN